MGCRQCYKLLGGDNDVKTLTLKVVILLAILYGQRAQEILTPKNLRNATFEENYVKIRIEDILETLPFSLQNT